MNSSQSMSPQPNWKTPLILTTLLLAGSSFVYWFQYSHKPKTDKISAEGKKPLSLPSEDSQIAMIRVKTGKGLIELKCQELATKNCKVSSSGHWKVTHPSELEGDADNVKDFLRNATTVLATETIDLKDETAEKRKKLLEEYGLSDQKRTDLNSEFVELDTEDGKHYAAWFGGEHPIGDKFFVARSVDGQINDQTIFLISNYFKNNLIHDLTYFRDKTLFKFTKSNIDSFEAQTSKGKLSAARVNSLWQINGLPADDGKIEMLIGAIEKTQAKEFPDATVYKGAKSILKYTLKEKSQTYTLEVLEKALPKAKQYFAKVSTRPEVVEIDSALSPQIDKTVNDLRQQTIFGDTDKITAILASVEFKGGQSPLAFEIKNGTWTAQDPASKLDGKKMQSLLDQLTQTRVTEFLSSVPAGVTSEMTVSIGDGKNRTKFHTKFLSVKDKIYAQDLNSKRKEIFLLNDSLKSSLPFTGESWKMK